MNIKSLLLGSAAAMVAVSGAQAADAVVIEPEPVEFVRVCDAYGSGFFFIPGTETCIRFGGFVRSSYEATYINREDAVSEDQDIKFWGNRARLNVDVRSETDFGTLRALYRLEGGDSNTDADIDMDIALISLAGFRAGFAGANYWSTNHGFAGVNFTGLGGTLGGLSQDDGYYGFNDGTIFDYTYAVDGFSVTVGVEDPRIDYAGLGEVGDTFSGGPDGGGVLTGASLNTDSRANFYAGLNYSADFGTFAFTYVRDNQSVDSTALAAGIIDRGGDAFKFSLSLDLSEFIPGGILYGSYAFDDDAITNYVHTNGLGSAGIDDAEEIFQISFQANLTDELELVTQYSHADGSDWGILVNGLQEEQEVFSIGLNWFPAAAPQFSLRASYTTGSVENAVGALNSGDVAAGSYDFDGFFVGVRRDF